MTRPRNDAELVSEFPPINSCSLLAAIGICLIAIAASFAMPLGFAPSSERCEFAAISAEPLKPAEEKRASQRRARDFGSRKPVSI